MNIIRYMAAAARRRHISCAGRRITMAVVTAEIDVRAGQRKRSMHIMIECRCWPCVTVVTKAALVAKSTLVWVVVPVAGGTVTCCIMKSIAGMALAARNRSMQAVEWKRCQVVIEAHASVPCSLGMALITLIIKLTTVRIVDAVTVTTSLRDQVHRCILMTGDAAQANVCLHKCEARVGVVENSVCPFRYLMARVALVTVAALMVIVHRMAVRTATIENVCVAITAMAVVALQPTVAVDERKAGGHMIEFHASPRCRRMTVLAGVTVRPLVRVVNSVTGRTSLWSASVAIVAMAVAAGDSRMSSA